MESGVFDKGDTQKVQCRVGGLQDRFGKHWFREYIYKSILVLNCGGP